MTAIVAIVGDSPAQCVTRALAACKCNAPENHPSLAPQLLAMVVPNEGEPSWPYVLVIESDGTGFDQNAEGIRFYAAQSLVKIEGGTLPDIQH